MKGKGNTKMQEESGSKVVTTNCLGDGFVKRGVAENDARQLFSSLKCGRGERVEANSYVGACCFIGELKHKS